MADPSYRRLDVDERRRQLLERGAELFTSHRYDELSMSRIAAEVGISKSLLYHYFPSKQAFFEATLGAWAEELRARTEPDPDLRLALVHRRRLPRLDRPPRHRARGAP
jgi:AcrR family transcriptional regulator